MRVSFYCAADGCWGLLPQYPDWAYHFATLMICAQSGVSTHTEALPALPQPHKNKNPKRGFVLYARLMGAEPTASPVTGACSTVELQPHFP